VIAEPRTRERAPVRRPAVVPVEPRPRGGGPAGNERLTALTAVVLLVLLAAEGATLISLRSFLTPHVFIGMLLVPVVALKVGSTGWRFLRYYAGHRAYRRAGTPLPLMRFLVAPVVLASTTGLFASGIALVAFGPGHPLVVGLHKASFAVWLVAMSVHVLAYVLRVPQLVGADLSRRERLAGARARQLLVAFSLVAGTTLAIATLPLVHSWHGWLFE
jgi:hypothetical protein